MSTTNEINLSNCDIREKINAGEYTIENKEGRVYSKVWATFGFIKDSNGILLHNFVICKVCKNFYKYTPKCTSNLVKHKCYLINKRKDAEEETIKTDVNTETKKKATWEVTKFIIKDTRPFNIINGEGFKDLMEFLLKIGAKFGPNVNINNLMPSSSTISRNVSVLKSHYMQMIKMELEEWTKSGFALTSDIWTDNFLKKTYICLTIGYIKNGEMINRVLGMRSIEEERQTGTHIRSIIDRILSDLNLEISTNVTIVTDRGRNIVAAFPESRINCINHLINNVVEKAIKNCNVIDELVINCTKLVKYFKKSGSNSGFQHTLKSFTKTRWNTVFYMLESIEKNWNNILSILQEKNKMEKVDAISFICIQKLVEFLRKIEQTSTTLEGSNYATIHLVIVYVNYLKRICVLEENDNEQIKNFKRSMESLIVNIIENNLSEIHKLAIYLFPPTNNLNIFNTLDKNIIKQAMYQKIANLKNTEATISETAPSTTLMDIFGESLNTCSEEYHDPIKNELRNYDNLNIKLNDNFDVLKWWDANKAEFPYLYLLSKEILCVPASSAASERVFSNARNLITEKRTRLDSNLIDEIMFLNSNIKFEDALMILDNKA